jgi:hypothetical protein
MSSDVLSYPPERPTPPPGFVPPAPPPSPPVPYYAPPSPPVAPPAMPAGYTKSIGFTISPKLVAWLPAVLLTIVFFCTCFSWVASYHGGYPVYSQSPWQSVVGNVSRNFKLEANMPGSVEWLDKVKWDAGLVVPFLLLLLLAMVTAWTERCIHDVNSLRFPRLAKVWPWRMTIIGTASGLAFFFVVAQVSSGFGMEQAIRKAVHDDPVLVKAREEAGTSPAKLGTVKAAEEVEVAKYNIERTLWQDAALLCNLFAVLAVWLSICLEHRGNKPPPKILLHY